MLAACATPSARSTAMHPPVSAPPVAPPANDVMEDEGALGAGLPGPATEGGLDADPEEPHPGSLHWRPGREAIAGRCGDDQKIAAGDRGETRHDAGFCAVQHEREQCA